MTLRQSTTHTNYVVVFINLSSDPQLLSIKKNIKDDINDNINDSINSSIKGNIMYNIKDNIKEKWSQNKKKQ